MLRSLIAAALALAVLSSGAEARQRHVGIAPMCDNHDVMRPCAYQPNFLAGVRSINVTMHRVGPSGRRTPAKQQKVWREEGDPYACFGAGRYDAMSQGKTCRSTVGNGVIRSISGATAHVSPRAAGAFQCLVTALDGAGYPVKFMGGYGRGSVRGSLHPAGLALDVNQISRGVTSPRMPANEIALANSCGLVSGAQWADNDSGHFQVGGWAGTARRHRVASR